MAFPFGGHPTLTRIVEWLSGHGCTFEERIQTSAAGRAYRVLEIRSPKGGHVIIANPDWQEHLSPSLVTYIQRRLGIRTPFAAMPEKPTDESEGD
jgi:hypothetical protein